MLSDVPVMPQEHPPAIHAFEILTKLSSGGMGDVLLARRRGAHGFEKLLAVKTIRGDLAKRPDIRAMFLDEARLVARLDHPAIAQVYDFGEEDGSLYLAMEYVPGIALNKLLMKRGGPLPPMVALKIAAEVCRGIHAAHELTDLRGELLGVVHRDMSPGNLILTFDGHTKILDFGIAFMNERESPDTQVGELKGKPSYMAPEQLRAEQVDRRSDLYSLSVVLHEMLTGRKLFIKNNVVATALAVERGDVPSPSSINLTLPEGIDEVVMKGLQRAPEARYQSAREMARAIDEFLSLFPNAPSLEHFVDTELFDERAQHKRWLQAVLSGEFVDSGSYSALPPSAVHRASEATGDEDQSITKNEGPPKTPTPSAAEARPLNDPTLVPAATAEVRANRSRRAVIIPLLFVLSVAFGAGLIYRSASDRSPDIQPIAPIEPQPPKQIEAKVEPKTPPETLASAKTSSAGAEPDLPEGDAHLQPEPIKPIAQAPKPGRRPKRPDRRRKPPKQPPQTKPTTFGYVTVGAKPYARVRIDGQEIGVTPIMRKRLPTGPHVIQLVRPDTGEVRLTKKVNLTTGQHARITQNR